MRHSKEYDVDNIDLSLADDCAQFLNDPYGHVMWSYDWGHGELVGFDGPDKWQKEQLIEIGEQVKANGFNGFDPVNPIRQATSSGHGVGKSALTSWLIMWIMSTRPNAKGIVTANTSDQLKTKTWGELGKWLRRSLVGHWFSYSSGRGSMAMYHHSNSTDWRVDALTCREENSESFAGQHSAGSTSFYIFDEASAVPDVIWDVAEGGLTDGEPMFFVYGNPTRNTGKFRNCFKAHNSRWSTHTVDSRTARMTNKELLAEWEKDHGVDSDFYRVRVLGKFPKAGEMQFISNDDVTKAQRRPLGRYLADDPLICGIDVSRGGKDDCMIGFRRGKDAKSEKVYRIKGEDSRNSSNVISKISMILDRHQPDVTFLDETGLGGPMVDRLNQLGYHVVGIGFGHDADDKSKFSNKTAEMGFRCRQWLIEGGAIHDDQRLEDELICREFWHDDKDRLVLERKKDVKKRLKISPDWADQLYLTFAQIVPKRAIPRGMLDAATPLRNKQKSHDYDPLDYDVIDYDQ